MTDSVGKVSCRWLAGLLRPGQSKYTAHCTHLSATYFRCTSGTRKTYPTESVMAQSALTHRMRAVRTSGELPPIEGMDLRSILPTPNTENALGRCSNACFGGVLTNCLLGG
jgi:hypothetical protein